MFKFREETTRYGAIDNVVYKETSVRFKTSEDAPWRWLYTTNFLGDVAEGIDKDKEPAKIKLKKEVQTASKEDFDNYKRKEETTKRDLNVRLRG